MILLLAGLLIGCEGPPPEVEANCRAVHSTDSMGVPAGWTVCRTEFPDAVCYSTEGGLACWEKAHEGDLEATP